MAERVAACDFPNKIQISPNALINVLLNQTYMKYITQGITTVLNLYQAQMAY